MARKKKGEQSLESLQLLNDAAFERMCLVLKLSEKERQFVGIAIVSYEMSKKLVGQH